MIPNGSQTVTTDLHRTRINLGIQNVVVYCACFSLLFVLTSILVEVPISTMMINQTRKNIGVIIFVCAISFFSVFSFKTSRSSVCFLPFFFVLILVGCPLFLLWQEPRYAFNSVKAPGDVLPFCPNRDKYNKTETQKKIDSVFHISSPKRYVVFQPTNTGLGNRILALVSSYLLALVTSRQLLVDWQTTEVFGAQFSSLFQSDIIKPLSSVLKNQTMGENDYHFLNLVYCRQCSLRIRHPHFALLASEDLNVYFSRKYIIVRSNVYFAPDLMANLHHRDLLCIVFDPKHLFHSLFTKLLKLSKELENEYNNTLNSIENRNVIGIQVRLKDRVGFPKNRVGSFFNCANHISSRYENPLFFVASDSEELKRQAILLYGDNKLIKFDESRESRIFSEKGIKDAVLDLMVLSRCKELVLTPYSTFGAVAAGISEVEPHFVTRKEGYCVQDVTSEPKFHYWHALSLYSIPMIGSSDMLNQDDSFL